jgi:uncharacterized protein YdaU (DUF1376 family)
MHKYWRHIGDYAKDTRHLSILEHGAYTLMLDWCYASEKPLPDDEKTLFRLCGAFEKAEQKAVLLVLNEFFTRENDGWTQKRVLAEVATFRDKQDKATRAAEASWESRRNAGAKRTQSERIENAGSNAMPRARVPTTNNQQPSLLASGDAGTDILLEVDLPKATEIAAPAEPSAKKKKGGAGRERNEVFDALAEVCGVAIGQVTRALGGEIGKARADILAVSPDVTPTEIRRRADAYRKEWPKATLSPSALAKHWGRYAAVEKKEGGRAKWMDEPTWRWREMALHRLGWDVSLDWGALLERMRSEILQVWNDMLPIERREYEEVLP